MIEIGEEKTVKLVSYAFADEILPEPEPEREDIVYNVTVDFKQVTLLERDHVNLALTWRPNYELNVLEGTLELTGLTDIV